MKYIIILLTTLLFSCNNHSVVYNGSVVKKIEFYDDVLSVYYAKGVHPDNGSTCGHYSQFLAPRNLYNVGDTIQFTKK